MIPQHGGDLRAEWIDFCENPVGLGIITFPVNLALAFGTQTEVSVGCCIKIALHHLSTFQIENLYHF